MRRGGRQIQLAQQPFKVLSLLASRAGEVVTRDELRRQIWGDETYVDFERGLNYCILQIRRALGDDARAPRFVETLPRRGYRFVAPVETLGEKTRPARRWRRTLVFIAALAIALAAGIFLGGRAGHRPLSSEPSERVMLAVLPFKNLSGEPQQDYFSDGFTEEMIAQLGGLDPERLGVIARTSIERYKDTLLDVAVISAELGVEFLLEGSVRRDSENVRITAQLIRADDQTHLWAQSYDRNQWGALVVQREVAKAIAEALQLELLPEGRSLPDRAGSHHPDAHDAYLRARYLQHKADLAELQRSVELFQRAIELDPEFALPHAGLAESYHHLVMVGGAEPRRAYPLAKVSARAALALDPSLAEGHLAAALAAFWHDWDRAAAERSLRRALELNPSFAEAHHDLGWVLIADGRPDAGLEHLQRARELAPLSPTIQVDAGWALIQARRFDHAIRQCARTLELEPGLTQAEDCQAFARLLRDRDARSLQTVRDRLRTVLAESSEGNPRRVALHYALLGQSDPALEWLEKAYEWRQPSLVLLSVDPAFDSLRDDPRFADLLRRVELPSR